MRRHVESLSDWLVVGLAPTLIGLLLGSLVCFIVEVLYQGEFNARLQFVFCMFVMASVCIARISLEEGTAYAALFAAPLALVTAFALATFVEYTGPLAMFSTLINLGIMGGIWWCSHQLVKDSTLIEDGPDETGAGLLTQLGWERDAKATSQAEVIPEPEAVTGDEPPRERSWFAQFLRPIGPHSPGAWAFYFSLAALPIFGIGQFFLDKGDLAGRRWVFQLLVIYVAAALGLLLTTSFLGIRRYLNQRRLDLPLDMAAAWLAVGTAMIAALLLVGFLLPRPLPEYSIAEWVPEIKSPARDPSQYSVGKEGTKKGEPGKGEGKRDDGKSGKNDQGRGSQPGKSGGEPGGKQPGEKGQGEKGQGEKGQGEKGGDPSGEQSQGGEKSSPADKSPSGEPSSGPKSPPQNGQEKENGPPGTPKTGRESQPQSEPQQTQAPPPPTHPPSPPLFRQFMPSLADALNYLLFAVILAAAAYYGYRHREFLREAWRKLLAELAELWAKLFGRPASATKVTIPGAPPPLPPGFATFRDPFATGQAAKWSLAELVRYSFQALEAWGRERGNVRTEEQTPGEYAQAVAAAQPTVATEVQQLAALYGQVAYGPGAASAPAAEIVRRFWLRLSQAPA